MKTNELSKLVEAIDGKYQTAEEVLMVIKAGYWRQATVNQDWVELSKGSARELLADHPDGLPVGVLSSKMVGWSTTKDIALDQIVFEGHARIEWVGRKWKMIPTETVE